jgi:hypothetical protein
MSQLATIPAASTMTTIVPTEIEHVVAIASQPDEMCAAQGKLILWARQRLDEARQQQADLQENVEIAKKNKWGSGGLERAYSRAVKVTEYYEKILAALEAGFVLVPNFPVEVFAIRTRRRTPNKQTNRNKYDRKPQTSEAPPAGAGGYVGAFPAVWQRNLGKDPKDQTRDYIEYFAKAFQPVDFPFSAAKPVILDATERAMALKCFDSIGALPASANKGDPIIVGRIEHAGTPKWNRKTVTFMIAWFVDTREL